MNNFKELEKEQLKTYEHKTSKVKKSVDNTISTFSFLGNVIDLYFTRMFNVMVDLTNTDQDNSNSTDEDDIDNIDINALLD